MLKALCSLIFFFALVLTLSARIGESLEDANRRYGTPVGEVQTAGGYLNNYYLKNNFLICVVFKGNQAVSITYSRPDINNKFYQQSLQSKQWADIINYSRFCNVELTTYVIKHLLKVNLDGKEWTEILKNDFWQRSDGVEAMYDKDKKNLTINSPGYINHIKSSAAQDLVGF
ncbi:MAG: hypothetical protein A2017_02180 [Lentisphaerae bacterium GWF2_44_16]|nr:MAG: hypothetical protein A2017_02180 [Lentisphaerae bacterium GWF2_44_16]